jgi:hypothetical protein
VGIVYVKKKTSDFLEKSEVYYLLGKSTEQQVARDWIALLVLRCRNSL